MRVFRVLPAILDLNQASSMADSDVGKLFVGGISRDTSEATLRSHFSKYGDVSSSIIAKDRITGTPRGFGFITFSDPSSVDKALQDHHVIGGRTVEVKRAIPRNEQTNCQKQQQQQLQQQQQHSQIQPQVPGKGLGTNTNDSYGSTNCDQHLKAKKIFVGGLSSNLTEEEFKSYFEKFGRITDVVVMRDNVNRPRGFGFITFDSEEAVENILQKSQHELAGKSVEVKIAVPRDGSKNPNNRNNPRFAGGRFSPVAGFTEENHWGRGPRYGCYPGQIPVSTTYPGYYYGGVYGGGYPVGGYGVVGYGMPMVAPRNPWNGYGLMGVRPLAYGTGYYPTGVNGGVTMMGMVNPYNNIMEPVANVKPDPDVSANTQVTAKDATAGGRSDVDGLNLKTGKGVVNIKKSTRAPDSQAQSKVPAVA